MKRSKGPVPLRLAPVLKEKVWGGTRLEGMFGQEPPAGRRIGEAWTAWDALTVVDGAWAGETLADVVRRDPPAVLGSRLADHGPLFPLLVKFVDTDEALSVQVHPDDDYARRREGQPFGKAEMWLVVEAAPGAVVFRGLKRRLTRTEAQEAVAAGTFQELLVTVELARGDVLLNLPGTVHALGPGLLLYELQQSSDLTYRLYDWNRNDPARPLHLEKALDVAELAPPAAGKIKPIEVAEPGARRSLLCACRQFAAEQVRVWGSAVERPAGLSVHILTVLEGEGTLLAAAGPSTGVRLGAGDSVVVPAAVQEYELRAGEESLVVVKAWVPDVEQDIVVPLREKGIPEADIRQLGGSRVRPAPSP